MVKNGKKYTAMIEKEKKYKKCCLKNLNNAVRKGRAHRVCPVCGTDISLMWVLYQDAVHDIIAEDPQ